MGTSMKLSEKPGTCTNISLLMICKGVWYLIFNFMVLRGDWFYRPLQQQIIDLSYCNLLSV